MTKPPHETLPTDRELQALKVLWEREGATVREICESMREQGTELAYTTVLSLLQVMEQKGMVRHEAAGKTYRYSARADRDETLARLAAEFLERVFDGALDEYLLYGLEGNRLKGNRLTPVEARRLEDVIRQAKQRRGRPRVEDTP